MKRNLIAALAGLSMVAAVDAATAEKARLRLYDGGLDEQPLQVQANLFNPKTDTDKVGEGEIAPSQPSSSGHGAPIEESPEN